MENNSLLKFEIVSLEKETEVIEVNKMSINMLNVNTRSFEERSISSDKHTSVILGSTTLTPVAAVNENPPVHDERVKGFSKQLNDFGFNTVTRIEDLRPNRKTLKSLVTDTYAGTAEIEGLGKFTVLHVSNLKPETSAEIYPIF